MRPQAAEHSAEAVEAALRSVLERDARAGRSPLEQLVEWLLERFDVGRLSETSSALLRALLAVGVVLLVVLLVRWAYLERRRAQGAPAVRRRASLAERVASLRAEAARARAAGDLRLALRRGLAALVLGLGGRGDLEYREAWTNRELLRRGRPSRAVAELLGALLHELEPKEYGREPVTQADLDRLDALCERLLGPAGEPLPDGVRRGATPALGGGGA